MICSCGKRVPDGSRFCPDCGRPVPVHTGQNPYAPSALPENKAKEALTLNIVLTVLGCCCGIGGGIFSLIGIFVAVGGNNAYKRGDYELANRKARTAKTLALISCLLTVLFSLLSLLLYLLSTVLNVIDPSFIQEFMQKSSEFLDYPGHIFSRWTD